jgi:hypothetical protein
MAGIRRWLVTALEFALLGALLVGTAALFRLMSSQSSHPSDQQAGSSAAQSLTEQPYPPPAITPTATPEGPYPPPIHTEPDWVTLPTPTDFPTSTSIPFPTKIPTPYVTQFPVAKPPVIPSAIIATPEDYTVVIRNENILFAVNCTNLSQAVLVNVSDYSPLFLNNEGSWGTASPDGTKLALVLKSQKEFWKKGRPIPEYSIHLFELSTKQLQYLGYVDI